MKKRIDTFKVLLCGRHELVKRMGEVIVKSDEAHVQFTSSLRFLLSRAIFRAPDIVFIDASFDKKILREVLDAFRAQFKGVPVYVLSQSASHREAVDMMNIGANGYFALPDDVVQLREVATRALEQWRVSRTQIEFLKLEHRAYDFSHIIGRSARLAQTLEHAKKVIENPALTVLIQGETGTGKELLARAIHINGKNSASPFVDIGCSALPETLLESELFGFERGAFTDARERKTGLFELAGEGTIFLDEIGDISPAMQSKLLKVIESRTMRRLGGLKDIPVRARIIAATGVDLDAKIRNGSFRKDLYHRLKIIPLEVRPLRDRKDDIPLLVDAFIKLFNSIYTRSISGIEPRALELLMEQEWEGNIRELKHCVERAVLLEEGNSLVEKDFDFLARPSAENTLTRGNGQGSRVAGSGTLVLTIPLDDTALEHVERKLALKVLEVAGGNKSKASYMLRISRPRLDRILRRFDD